MDQQIKSKCYVFTYGFLLASSGLFFGYQIGCFNTYFTTFIESVYDIVNQNEQQSIHQFLNFYLLIGGLLSCVVTGYLIEYIGRFEILIVTTILNIIVLCLEMISSQYVLYSARLLGGFSMASQSFLVMIMVREILPSGISGNIAASFGIFLTGGILLGYFIGSQSSGETWRLVMFFPASIEIPKLFLYLFFFNVQSPKTIYMKNDNPEKLLEENYLKIYQPQRARVETQSFVDEMKKFDGKRITGLSDLTKVDYKLQFCIGMILNLLNQLTGINILILYSTDIFNRLKLTDPKFHTLLLGLQNLLGSAFAAIFGMKIGKRQILILGLAMQTASYIILLIGLVLKIGLLVSLGAQIFIFSFAMSLGTMAFVYLADILPSVAFAFTAIAQWGTACIIGLIGLELFNIFGEFFVFYFFMAMSFIGCIIFAGLSIDTFNKTEFQIKQEFIGKKFYG